MTQAQKELKARYIDLVMREAFHNDASMRKHFESTIFSVVEIAHGYLIPIEKSRIQKHFCFGYSDSAYDTQDYDRANAMAKHAGESESYFLAENLKPIDAVIDAFEIPARDRVGVARVHYWGSPNNSKVRYAKMIRLWELDEMTEEQKAETYFLTKEDREKIVEALKEQRDNFKKRLFAYLKRYGMQNVRTWSYWRDE